jgi:hypothetical protein
MYVRLWQSELTAICEFSRLDYRFSMADGVKYAKLMRLLCSAKCARCKVYLSSGVKSQSVVFVLHLRVPQAHNSVTAATLIKAAAIPCRNELPDVPQLHWHWVSNASVAQPNLGPDSQLTVTVVIQKQVVCDPNGIRSLSLAARPSARRNSYVFAHKHIGRKKDSRKVTKP